MIPQLLDVQNKFLCVSSHLYDVLQVGAGAGIALCLQIVQESRDMLIINAPQVLQHRPSTGRDRAQQAHSTAGVFPHTELPALNGVNAADEGLDLLGEFLGARVEGEHV